MPKRIVKISSCSSNAGMETCTSSIHHRQVITDDTFMWWD